jgi:hypothetical protein
MRKKKINRINAAGFVHIGFCSSYVSSIISKEYIIHVSIFRALQLKFNIII